MKLGFPRSPLGADAFADFDRGSDAGSARPLLVYLGGAVSPAEYARRRDSVPQHVFDEARAAGYAGAVLVVAPPPALPGRAPDALAPLTRSFEDDLLPAIGFVPDSIGLVGFSFGASLAVLLARRRGLPVRALAAMAPAGAAEAAELSDSSLDPLSCPVLVATNLDDPYHEYAETFLAAAHRHGVRPVTAIGPGEHRFMDYAANGLAARAFGFVAERLRAT